MGNEIQVLQELSNLTWPPKMILNLNGWKIRISEGVTMRTNSVSPMEYYGDNITEDIMKVENYYRASKFPSIFQLHDSFKPASLQEELLTLDYEIVDETIVMTANIVKISIPKLNEKYEYQLLENELDKWLNDQQILNQVEKSIIDGRREIISRITQSNVGYFRTLDNGETIAVGLAVIQENYMAIYSMFTHPDYRRKGIAQTLMAKMIEWGDINLVDKVFLQVETSNNGARELYEKAGFNEKYRYRYLVKQ